MSNLVAALHTTLRIHRTNSPNRQVRALLVTRPMFVYRSSYLFVTWYLPPASRIFGASRLTTYRRMTSTDALSLESNQWSSSNDGWNWFSGPCGIKGNLWPSSAPKPLNWSQTSVTTTTSTHRTSHLRVDIRNRWHSFCCFD